jgi:pimeloyl-ACP methyl ester carboxylesterase
LATYCFGGDGPPVMLLHATGFHGRGWLPLAPALTERFTVWSVDQRGHGASGKAPDGRYDDWSVFVDDLFPVLDAIGGEGWSAFGHSLGGGVLLLAEQRRPGTFRALCLYEPVVIPAQSAGTGFDGSITMGDLARKRRRRFDSFEAARANFAAKPPMNTFAPDALDAYVNYGFLPDPEGGVSLACTPDDEASVYDGAATSGAWDHLDWVRAPTMVLGGGLRQDPVNLVVEEVARRLPRGGARRFPDLSHFGPFEAPLVVGRVAADALVGGAGAATEGPSTAAVAPSG